MNLEQLKSYNGTCIIEENQTFSYQDLVQNVAKYQVEISSKINKGDVVCVQSDYSFESISLFLALMQNSCIIVPIVTTTEAEFDLKLKAAFITKIIKINEEGLEISDLKSENETPESTEGYEGFYHVVGVEGSVEEATISYIIRDHDRAKFEERKECMKVWGETINAKYGAGTVTVDLKDQYYNMRMQIEPVMHIIDTAFKAMEEAGVTPKVKAIRGGTDGAQLSFKGLPCPNIFAGGLNFHGRYEFVPVQSMEKAMMVVVKIAELVAKS